MAPRDLTKIFFAPVFLTFVWFCIFPPASGYPAKEFLTAEEIERLQVSQQIHVRVKLYLEFAASRLKIAEERLAGKEPEKGDPFELYSPEDMLYGYDRILNSVMLILDDAFEKSDPYEKSKVRKALKLLKEETENDAKQLEVLKKIAEEKKKEELWNLANQAIESAHVARQGAESGISKEPEPADKKPKKK